MVIHFLTTRKLFFSNVPVTNRSIANDDDSDEFNPRLSGGTHDSRRVDALFVTPARENGSRYASASKSSSNRHSLSHSNKESVNHDEDYGEAQRTSSSGAFQYNSKKFKRMQGKSLLYADVRSSYVTHVTFQVFWNFKGATQYGSTARRVLCGKVSV